MPLDKKWDGTTERRINAGDHDHITRMLVMNETIVDTLRETKTELDIHKLQDEKKFDFINRTLWGGFGALGMLELILRINSK
jgi:hypothetical protein